MNDSLEHFWRGFAIALPQAACVADLCCGNGSVLRALRTTRPDLSLAGYDAADVPPTEDNMPIFGGVDCSALAIPNHAMDAATSQFGLEYANGSVRAEAARIVAQKGTIAMVVHHCDSILVVNNVKRLNAIIAFEQSGLFDRARRVADGTQVTDVDMILASLATTHAGQSVIAELVRALQSALRNRLQVTAHITAIEEKARQEHVRLAAMQDAAKDRNGLTAMISDFGEGWNPEVNVLRADGHGIIGWSVILRRK